MKSSCLLSCPLVSMLRKHISDGVVEDSFVSADIQGNLSFDEIPIEILDFSV